MDMERDALANIKEVLKTNPRGMNVLEVANAIGMNRQSVAKYLEMLVVSGHVDVKYFGSSKVYYLSQRLPISSILSLSSDFIIILDKGLRIVNVNDKFLEFYRIKREDLIYQNAENLSFPIEFDPPIDGNIRDALAGKESVINAFYRKKKEEYFFIIKFIPSVFEDGTKGVTIIFIDVTESRKTELAIKASERKLRGIINQSVDGIILSDEQGMLIEYNMGQENITGIKKDDALGKDIREYMFGIIPEDRRLANAKKDLESMITKFLASGNSPHANRYMEAMIQCVDGSRKTVQFVIFSIKTESGYMICGITRDVTDRKLMENLLRDSENKYRVLAETTAAAIMVVHSDKFVEVNNATEVLTGYSRDELLGMNFLEMVHPDDREMVKSNAMARQQGEYIQPYEFRAVIKSGETRWAQACGGRTIYKGAVVSVLTLYDITESKKHLESLKKSEAILAKAQNIAHTGSFYWDMHDQFLCISDEDYRVLGYGEERPKLKYEDILSFVHPDDRANFEKVIGNALKLTRPFHIDYRIIRPDGVERIIHTEGEFTNDSSGKPHMMIGVNRDITYERRSHNRLSYLASFPVLNPNPIIEVNASGHINFLNPAAKSIFPDLVALGLKHPLFEGLEYIMENVMSNNAETTIRDVKVSDRYFHETIQTLPNKKLIRVYVIDITECKRAEEALRDSEATLRLAQRFTNVGMWSWDMEKNSLQLTDELYKIFGIKKDGSEISYEMFLQAVIPKDRKRVEKTIHDMLEKGKYNQIEFDIIGPGGERRAVRFEGDLVMDNGKPVKILGVCFDITNDK